MLVCCCCCKLILRFYPWCAGTEFCYTLVLKKLKPKGRNMKWGSPPSYLWGWAQNLNFSTWPSKQNSHRFISANRAKEEVMQTKVHFLKINIQFDKVRDLKENIMTILGLWDLLYTWIPFPVDFLLLYWHWKCQWGEAADISQKFNFCCLLWAAWWYKLCIMHPGLCRKQRSFCILFIFLISAFQ